MAMLVITRGYIIMTHLRICTPQTPGLVHQEDPRRCLLRWRCLKRPGQAKDSMVWDKNWASWGCQRHEMEWGVHGRVTCRWWEKMKSLRTAKDVDGSSVESGVWGTSESLIEMAPWRYTQKKTCFWQTRNFFMVKLLGGVTRMNHMLLLRFSQYPSDIPTCYPHTISYTPIKWSPNPSLSLW